MVEPNRFADTLASALEQLEQLQAVMLDEASAISARDADALTEIVANKEALLRDVEQRTAGLKSLLADDALGFSAEDIAMYFTRHDRDGTLGKYWNRLREVLSRCNQLNENNARLIKRDRERVTETLRILGGDATATTTYDPRGRANASPARSRTISQA